MVCGSLTRTGPNILFVSSFLRLRKKYLDFANLEIFTFKIRRIPPDLIGKTEWKEMVNFQLTKNLIHEIFPVLFTPRFKKF